MAYGYLGLGAALLLAVAFMAGLDLRSSTHLSIAWIVTLGSVTFAAVVPIVLSYLVVMGFEEVEFSVNSHGAAARSLEVLTPTSGDENGTRGLLEDSGKPVTGRL